MKKLFSAIVAVVAAVLASPVGQALAGGNWCPRC